MAGCKKKEEHNLPTVNLNTEEVNQGDSTVYGECVDAAMNSISVLTSNGDTIEYIFDAPGDDADVQGGVFLGDSEYTELNDVLNELAEKYDATADAIAYAWLLRYPARMQVILGTTNPARVRSAARATDFTLTRGEWYALYKAAGNKLP